METREPEAVEAPIPVAATAFRRIREYMSARPVFVAHDVSVLAAHRIMRENGVRHLPVLEDGALVGLITEADVHLVESLRSADPAEETVEATMQPDPLVVAGDEPLDLVVDEMVRGGYHAAVILEGVHVVGVFTHTDALRALVDVLRG